MSPTSRGEKEREREQRDQERETAAPDFRGEYREERHLERDERKRKEPVEAGLRRFTRISIELASRAARAFFLRHARSNYPANQAAKRRSTGHSVIGS